MSSDKEKSIKVKKEKLRATGHLVSPESKKDPTFGIMRVIRILKERNNIQYQESELREMLKTWRRYKNRSIENVEKMSHQAIISELQIAQNQLTSQDYDFAIDEVVAILKSTNTESLANMETEELREMLKQWNKYNNEDVSKLHLMVHTELVNALEDVKSVLVPKNDNDDNKEGILDQIDRETDHIFAIVSKMNITSDTTEAQILEFNDEELAYFQYVKSLQNEKVPDMDNLKECNRNDLVKFCKSWIVKERRTEQEKDKILECLSDSDEEFSNKNLNTTEDDDVVMTDKEDDSISIEPTSMELDDIIPIDLGKINTIPEFKKLDDRQKCEWIHKKSTEKGEEIHIETLLLWSEDQLDKIAKTMMNNHPESKTSDTSSKTKSSLKKNSKYTKKLSTQTDLFSNTMQPWRYSLFLTSPQDKKGTEGLINYLGDIFHEMGTYCAGIQLLPWDSDTLEDGIEDCEDLPRTITQLKKYFKGARAPTGASKQYLKIRLGYPITTDRPTFEADMMGWCKEREIRMYECALQHPNTKMIGWLAYFPSTVDRKKWCIATQELYQVANKNGESEEIKLGIVWKALNGQWDVPQKDKLYAFHVETSLDQATRIKKFLRLVAQNKKYPLGVRFRLTDEYNQYMKETSKVKYKYMFDKHKTLSKEMRQVETSKILNPDKRIGISKFTLRDIVTNIRDKTDNRRVFNTIDQKYNNPSVYVAQYRPDKADLAKAHIFSLVTYVKHLHPDANLSKVFTIDALEESEVEIYYPTTQTFLTQEDIDFDAVIQEDLDDDSFEYLNVNNVNPFEIQLPEKLKGGEKLYNLNGDDDTASTMPAQSSTISFSNASVHLYDTKSLVSEISNMSENKKTKSSAESITSKKRENRMDAAQGA